MLTPSLFSLLVAAPFLSPSITSATPSPFSRTEQKGRPPSAPHLPHRRLLSLPPSPFPPPKRSADDAWILIRNCILRSSTPWRRSPPPSLLYMVWWLLLPPWRTPRPAAARAGCPDQRHSEQDAPPPAVNRVSSHHQTLTLGENVPSSSSSCFHVPRWISCAIDDILLIPALFCPHTCCCPHG